MKTNQRPRAFQLHLTVFGSPLTKPCLVHIEAINEFFVKPLFLFHQIASAILFAVVKRLVFSFFAAVTLQCMAASHPSFIESYCADCHDGVSKKGGLDLETISRRDIPEHAK